VSCAAGDESLSGSVSAVKDRFPEALRLFASMLRAPRFDPSRLEVEKAREMEDIRRRGTIWNHRELTFRRLVYGAASPWARLSPPIAIVAHPPRRSDPVQSDSSGPTNAADGGRGRFRRQVR